MPNIIVNSSDLGAIAHEVEQGCFMLGFVNDEDDMEDVHYYAQRIQRAADALRGLIKAAKQSEDKQGE